MMTNKGGRHARTAALLCQDSRFRLYLDRRRRVKFNLDTPDGTHTEQDAREFILQVCEIRSRAELDHNQEARERFFHLQRCYGRYLQRMRGGNQG